MPIADNQVTFRVSGEAKAIGAGNGDPTSHESDKGSSRKAFNGLCMALVQSTKTAGSITVEASSPSLTPSSVTIFSKAVKLRPQAAVWEREVPAGPGITGLWRTAPATAAAGFGGGGFGGGASPVFTFRQNGSALTGTVEGGGGFGGGGDAPIAIENGKIDGARISFNAASVVYTGTLIGDAIELQRTGGMGGRGGQGAPPEPAGPRPFIGPPPDGTDPSRGVGGRGPQRPAPMVLQRAKR